MSTSIFGFHPVREALRHRPQHVARVLVGRGRRGKRREEIEELCRRHQVTVQPVGEGELAQLVSGVHNGFVAEVAEQHEAPAGRSVDQNLIVLIEDVQDPRNLGAILRVCEGAGVGRILIRDRGSAPISPAVVKASAGATEWLDVERIVNTANSIKTLQQEGFWVYGTAAEGTSPWELDLSGKLVLCFGGEGGGLRQRTRKLCDGLVGLPMRGAVASLNVSAAAAAVLYEAVRQRGAADPLPPSGGSG